MKKFSIILLSLLLFTLITQKTVAVESLATIALGFLSGAGFARLGANWVQKSGYSPVLGAFATTFGLTVIAKLQTNMLAIDGEEAKISDGLLGAVIGSVTVIGVTGVIATVK